MMTERRTPKNLKFYLNIALLISITTHQITFTNGANILGLFTSPSPSHLLVHMEMAKLLSDRGHNVTIVVTQKPKVNYKDIHVILIPPTEEQQLKLEQNVKHMSQQKSGILKMAKHFLGTFTNVIDMQADVLKDSRFTALYEIEEEEKKFDLIILGFFMNSHQLGVAAKMKTPVIAVWLSNTMVVTNRFIGNPTESAYVPGKTDVILPVGTKKMSFSQRVKNLFVNVFFDGIMRILEMRMNTYYKEIFTTGSHGEAFPTLATMFKNISLLFCSSHFSEGVVRPNVPAVVEIGGIQVKDKADPLPKDLAEFLDQAKHTGAILFSLGSNFKGSHLNPNAVISIYNVLSKVNYKIIWKWENLTQTPGNSSNIMYRKWLPQDDILAHNNLKLFITHAGRGSITEAQYHGKPMLAIPLFGDQHDNAQKMIKSGYGLMIDILSFDEAEFYKALMEALLNPFYTENIQKFSRLYRDRPQTARQSFIYWTEYVLRHHGAAHMQSPLVHMNFIEANNLDVMAFLLMVLYILCKIIKYLLKIICKFNWKVKKQ